MLIEVRLFQEPPKTIPVIPVTTTPYSKYNYAPEMTSEGVPWYLQEDLQVVAKEIYEDTLSDRTQIYTCKACGVVPSVRDRRYIVHAGKVHLVCSTECVEDIKSRRE